MSNIEKLKDVADIAIRHDSDGQPTQEKIRAEIAALRRVYAVTNDEAEQLARELESVHSVAMDTGSVLREAFTPWLTDAKSKIEPYFWNRYKRLLVRKKWSEQVLVALDKVTEKTLGLLENPQKEGPWDRRGMVVGHVQSGKTANYIGLINKAADAGYRVIIVIAGIHNNLRDQTQMRIDEGFIGFSSTQILSGAAQNRVIGVGGYDQKHRPASFTSTRRDFNTATASGVGITIDGHNEPIVFVIKKNDKTLENLSRWLTAQNVQPTTSTINSPMLLIDDEADNASINIKKGAAKVSKINGLIRGLLNVFSRSCYIGYTATPFANIFIDPANDDEMFGQDLFPRDFIVSLDPPDNYFGPTQVFIDDADKIIRYIEDNETLLPLTHEKEHVVRSLPQSLEAAVRTFVVARAVRLARGHASRHNSMLVNASRFNNVQRELHYKIHAFMDQIKDSVRVNGEKPEVEALKDPEINALRNIFEAEYTKIKAYGTSWSEVQKFLWDSASAIEVVEVNRLSRKPLNYAEYEQTETGLNVIAVGGFSLSRGLTLEGLVVSYFLRNSMMYDTLMQMGRWFGYRPEYHDLCRVWMPEEAAGWYAYITEAVEELREEFRQMEAVGATPKEFGLKVRSHPGALIVTARNKMGSAQSHIVSVGLANRFIETTVLDRTSSALVQNRKAAIALAQDLRNAGKPPALGDDTFGGKFVRSVPVSIVIKFIESFRNHPTSFLTLTDPVLDYINARSSGELKSWDILFTGLQSKDTLVDSSLGFDLFCRRRAPGKRSTSTTLLISNKQRVASRGIERVGLSDTQKLQAEKSYKERKGFGGDTSPNYPDRIYREVRVAPLLIIHLLAIGDRDQKDLYESHPVVAWSISFPKTSQEEKKVEYVANTAWFQEGYKIEDEDEAGGDDE